MKSSPRYKNQTEIGSAVYWYAVENKNLKMAENKSLHAAEHEKWQTAKNIFPLAGKNVIMGNMSNFLLTLGSNK